MKTEEIRATEIAITPYLTLTLFSVPGSSDIDYNTPGRSRHDVPAASCAGGEREWRLLTLAQSPARSLLHT